MSNAFGSCRFQLCSTIGCHYFDKINTGFKFGTTNRYQVLLKLKIIFKDFFCFDYCIFCYRSYILNYLANRPNLQHFVVQALVTLLAKITKYGWFDTFKNELIFQNLLEDVKTFLQVFQNI